MFLVLLHEYMILKVLHARLLIIKSFLVHFLNDIYLTLFVALLVNPGYIFHQVSIDRVAQHVRVEGASHP